MFSSWHGLSEIAIGEMINEQLPRLREDPYAMVVTQGVTGCERRTPALSRGGAVYSMCAVQAVLKMRVGPSVRIFRDTHQTTSMMHLW